MFYFYPVGESRVDLLEGSLFQREEISWRSAEKIRVKCAAWRKATKLQPRVFLFLIEIFKEIPYLKMH